MKENIWVYRRLNLATDLALTALAYALAAGARLHFDTLFPAHFSPDWQLLWIILPIWGLFLSINSRLYEYRMVSFGETLKNVTLTWLKCLGVLLAILYFAHRLDASRLHLTLFAVFNLFLLVASRKLLSSFLSYIRSRGYNQQHVLLVGSGKLARDFLLQSEEHPEWGWDIIGILDWNRARVGSQVEGYPVSGTLKELGEIIQNGHVDYVVFAVPRRFLVKLEQSISACEEMGVKAYVLADFFDLKIAKKEFRVLFNQPALFYSSGPSREGLLLFKYALDRILATLVLVLLSPLFLACALTVKFTSAGPVFFRQVRCGLNGRKFSLYKFRTMVENAEALKDQLLALNEMSGPVFKIKNDPRLTRVGRFLRQTSMDELPQLFNVLKGEMSLVGPRPPLPQEVSQYDHWQRRKLSIKPGLTCLWQVNGRNHIDFENWMKLDLHYIDNWSLWLDAKILLKTLPAVISGSGAK